MTIDIQHVQPGDLITASFFNGLIDNLLDELTALDKRLATLEGATSTVSVVISDVDNNQVHVGDDLTITGKNFGFSIGAHRVRFNGVPPTGFGAASSDTVLICEVPPIPGLPPTGGPVTVTVTNVALPAEGATASRTITVLPAQVNQAGNIDVLLTDVTPDILTADADNLFQFELSSAATLPAVVTLASKVMVAGNAVAWPIALLGSDHKPIPSNQVTLASGAKQTVVVRVSIPKGTNGTAFTLDVQGTAPGLPTASAGLSPMTVGQGGDPDPTFTLALKPLGNVVSGSTITVASGMFATVSVDVEITAPGTYNVTLGAVPGTSGWTVALADALPGGKFTVKKTDIPAGGTLSKVLKINVGPTAGASDPGQLRLTVQRQEDPNNRRRSSTFDLNVA